MEQNHLYRYFACSLILIIISFFVFYKYIFLPNKDMLLAGFKTRKEVRNESSTQTPENQEQTNLNPTNALEKAKELKNTQNAHEQGLTDGQKDCEEKNNFRGPNYNNSYEGEATEMYDKGYDAGYYGNGC